MALDECHDERLELTLTFKLSNNPHFAGKVQDIVGHCLNPPKAVVPCNCEKDRSRQSTTRDRA
jgi:hypothetical protein